MTRYFLTTEDNPFDPFDEFESWLQCDIAHGYHTCNVLASRAIVSNGEFSKESDEEAISDAIDEIIKEFPMIKYKKVEKEY